MTPVTNIQTNGHTIFINTLHPSHKEIKR